MSELIVLIRLTASAPPRSAASGDGSNVGHVGRELDDHRNLADFLHPRRDHLRVFGHLADGRAHAALTHAVRAAEIQFERIRAGIFGATHHLVPGFALGFDHQRSDHKIASDIAS